MLKSSERGNGHAPLPPYLPTGDEDAEVAVNQAVRDLNEKIDDVRASVADVSASVATLTGKVEVVAQTTELRLVRLEKAQQQQDFRAWVEKMIYAAMGAGGFELARRVFFGG